MEYSPIQETVLLPLPDDIAVKMPSFLTQIKVQSTFNVLATAFLFLSSFTDPGSQWKFIFLVFAVGSFIVLKRLHSTGTITNKTTIMVSMLTILNPLITQW